MNKLDKQMSKAMGWEVHEGLYGIFSRYFVVKEPKNITGYTTSGIMQDYYDWKPSANIRQATRVLEKTFESYTIIKSHEGYKCIGARQGCIFEGESKTMEKAICLAIAGTLNTTPSVRSVDFFDMSDVQSRKLAARGVHPNDIISGEEVIIEDGVKTCRIWYKT